MGPFCTCEGGLGNSGQPGCVPIIRQARDLIVVPLYTAAGALNKIASTDTLNQAFLDGKINNADKTLRWYPIKDFRNVNITKAEPVKETASGGQTEFIKKGIRSNAMQLWGKKASPQYAGILDGYKCQEFGIFIVDLEDKIIGMKPVNDDGHMYPIPVDSGSWNADFTWGTDETTNKIDLTFDWNQKVQDSQLIALTSNKYTFDVQGMDGLRDVYATFSDISTTGFTVKLELIYGGFKEKVPVTGLLLADFDLDNVTDSSAVTPSSVTESAAGTYDFVMPAQTSTDQMRLNATKNRDDFTAVAATPFAIP